MMHKPPSHPINVISNREVDMNFTIPTIVLGAAISIALHFFCSLQSLAEAKLTQDNQTIFIQNGSTLTKDGRS